MIALLAIYHIPIHLSSVLLCIRS